MWRRSFCSSPRIPSFGGGIRGIKKIHNSRPRSFQCHLYPSLVYTRRLCQDGEKSRPPVLSCPAFASTSSASGSSARVITVRLCFSRVGRKGSGTGAVLPGIGWPAQHTTTTTHPHPSIRRANIPTGEVESSRGNSELRKTVDVDKKS